LILSYKKGNHFKRGLGCYSRSQLGMMKED